MPRPALPALLALAALAAPAAAQEAPELRGRLSPSVVNAQSAGGGSAVPAGRSLRQRTIRIIAIDRNPDEPRGTPLLAEIQSGR